MICAKCGAKLADGSRFCGSCGNAIQPTDQGSQPTIASATALQPPDVIGREISGRYRILAKIGEGGMGAVYRAEQISLKRKCAVKLLRPELSSQPGLVRRFNAEAELAAQLNHPNTVSIYDFGQDSDGTLFIAMEYVEGKSLRNVLATDGALPPARALYIVSQIASSLTDAHSHGIVHRDLKPDNVMLTERGKLRDVVRVLDFGIAKIWDDKQQVEQAMTRAGDLVGTPQYMAPEQIRAETVDGRTDVYALGAMLYEMITGRLPFEGPTLMAILSRHLTEVADPPSRRRPDLGISPPLDAIVLEALAKRPDERPHSMERFGERVAEVAALIGAPLIGPVSGQATAQVALLGSSISASGPSSGYPSPGPPGPPPPGPARPTFRPPGVPHTNPPGVMVTPPTPPPPAPAPYAGTYPSPAPSPYAQPGYPPPPLPAGTPPPPGHTGPGDPSLVPTPADVGRAGVAAKHKKKSAHGILILVILSVVMVGGAAAFIIYRETKQQESETTRPTSGGLSLPDVDQGSLMNTPGGSKLVLPPGLTQGGNGVQLPGASYGEYTGTIDGAIVRVKVIEFPRATGFGDGKELAEQVVTMATQVSRGTRKVGDKVMNTFIVDADEMDLGNMRNEYLVISDDKRALVLGVAVAPDKFDASEGLRSQIFEQRFAF